MAPVLGHLLSHEFEPRFKSWASCDLSALFDARIEVFVSSDTLAGPTCTAPRFGRWRAQSNEALGRAGGTVRAHFNTYHLRRSSSCQSRRSASQRSSFTPRARSSCGRKLHPAPHS
ncbi:hypothetical protein TESG_05635 [Trichophyton tonsurans CBS 112818]|uniref:Uncharacterized protein n=1 Tax=Trichophyton tonsurans (strain CBS 112818) TaxID=647933 RepID=F2S3V6_TRIT1|nr:hypothetical protein TESG_05635 [Trichophyton tonsurans CBS 112818]